MKQILKIKNHHLKNGIKNSYLAEKAGIKVIDFYELDKDHPFFRKNFISRIAEVLDLDRESIIYKGKAKTG